MKKYTYRIGAALTSLAVAGTLAVAPASAAQNAPVAQSQPARSQLHVPLAKAAVAKQTTANLNLRSTPSTKGKILVVIPKNTTVKIMAQRSGWSRIAYAGKTGWVSNSYLRNVPAGVKAGGLGKTTAALKLRKHADTKSTVLENVPKAGIFRIQKISKGYSQITRRGKTGWVQSSRLVPLAEKPGREIYIDEKYTTNRAGLTDRYWTSISGADLHESVNGKKRINDIPKNSVVYRDLKKEKTAGSVKGWVFVRTQGMSGWMKTNQLKRKSTAATKNAGYSKKTVLAQRNGAVPEKMLVSIPWDPEKTLIAAPALNDLNRLNAAFKKKFGRNLQIDLAYRTRSTQDAYWIELGQFIAAKPGTSNHGWGTAIDFPETHDYSFRGKYYRWLKANSKNYNWTHRKNLEEGSPYAEAWHFEYSGR